ncbi:hypothetical protein Pint_09710 [Pistacia integerrima]|uniref:Uncharacterized protein n=1 Tax=Pistacia integerrima TaxID=434235 RepID=A0ACC0XK22_9ROSI|nr:hypothetical protein Pint_09710 [Pistacia integerrima]
MATSKLQALWNHPAGPKTIHFWAPTFKWGISIANVADFAKPPEKLSYPQQIAVAATGIIWSRYSTVITPGVLQMSNELRNEKRTRRKREFCIMRAFDILCLLCELAETAVMLIYAMILFSILSFCPHTLMKNWNLFSVNVAMAGTGLYQLSRKIRHDYFSESEEAAVAKE